MDKFSEIMLTLGLYFFLFLLPIFLYLKLKSKVNPLTYLKLNNKPLKGITIGVFLSITYIIILTIRNYILGEKSVSWNIGVLWFSIITVGFLEEIPFRGFILQNLESKISFWTANILTTLLFVVMHYSTWISSNDFFSCFSIAFMSLLFGYIYKESDSLWVPIICHSVYNMTIWVGMK